MDLVSTFTHSVPQLLGLSFLFLHTLYPLSNIDGYTAFFIPPFRNPCLLFSFPFAGVFVQGSGDWSLGHLLGVRDSRINTPRATPPATSPRAMVRCPVNDATTSHRPSFGSGKCAGVGIPGAHWRLCTSLRVPWYGAKLLHFRFNLKKSRP
jgi:hypothetical protein